MTIPNIPRRLGCVCTMLAAVVLAAGYTAPVAAQLFHAFGVQMACDTLSKVGEEVTCTSRAQNQDDFDDNHEVKQFWHVVDPGGINDRLPDVGNLPITAVSAGTTCTATAVGPNAPIGLTFPCTVPSTGGVSPFEFVEVKSTHTVPNNAPDPGTVQATAIEADLCDDPNTQGCSTVDNQQQQPASVNLFQASIEVTKTGPDLAKVGDEVTYTVSFENTSSGDTPPLSCTASDSLAGPLGPITAGVPLNFNRIVQQGDPDPLVNTATVTCSVQGFDNIVEDSDDHSLNLFDSSIAVTKTGPALAKVGDEVTYSVVFENTSSGDTPPLSCTASDSLAGPLGPITAGVPINFNRIVQQGDPDPLVNVATVSCTIQGFDNIVEESDDHSLNLFDPSIAVTKVGPDTAKVGDEVTYTISFENTSSGDTPPLSCTASDSLGGDLGPITAGVPINFNRIVEANDPDPLVNIATVTCTVEGFDNIVEDSDDHSVDLLDPAIEVTKTGPETAKVGDEFEYTISFANVGDGAVENCTGNDPLLGGDLGAFDEGVPRVFPFTPQAGDPDPLDNTVTITCDVVGLDNQVSDDDSHRVDLIDPAIEVTKTGPETAKVGDDFEYTISFANVGDGAVENCTGNDPLLGGDLGAFDEGVPRVFPFTPQAGDPDPLDNTVTITCDVVGFDNQVSDDDSHSVDLVDPSVALSKECRPDPVTVGGTINWAITVDNTGDANLDCLVNDAEAGFVDEPVAVPAGGSETLNASRTVEAGDFPVIMNDATVVCDVEGFDNQVDDEASAECEVVVVEEICRTPGFWGTHGGTEKKNSSNLTQTVIDAAGGSLSICGQTIDNTGVGNMMSALEAICVSVQGEQQLQLARQLTAAALNCVISGAPADCTGASIENLFANANAACAANAGDLSGFIERIDCFNNGGQFDEGLGECVIGSCSITEAACNEDNLACPPVLVGDIFVPQQCVPTEGNCHDVDLGESDVFNGISPLPGPAGSSRACNAATKNDTEIIP